MAEGSRRIPIFCFQFNCYHITIGKIQAKLRWQTPGGEAAWLATRVGCAQRPLVFGPTVMAARMIPNSVATSSILSSCYYYKNKHDELKTSVSLTCSIISFVSAGCSIVFLLPVIQSGVEHYSKPPLDYAEYPFWNFRNKKEGGQRKSWVSEALSDCGVNMGTAMSRTLMPQPHFRGIAALCPHVEADHVCTICLL